MQNAYFKTVWEAFTEPAQLKKPLLELVILQLSLHVLQFLKNKTVILEEWGPTASLSFCTIILFYVDAAELHHSTRCSSGVRFSVSATSCSFWCHICIKTCRVPKERPLD